MKYKIIGIDIPNKNHDIYTKESIDIMFRDLRDDIPVTIDFDNNKLIGKISKNKITREDNCIFAEISLDKDMEKLIPAIYGTISGDPKDIKRDKNGNEIISSFNLMGIGLIPKDKGVW